VNFCSQEHTPVYNTPPYPAQSQQLDMTDILFMFSTLMVNRKRVDSKIKKKRQKDRETGKKGGRNKGKREKTDWLEGGKIIWNS